MKQLVEYLARSLVDCPEAVKVSERSGDFGTIVELKVDEKDVGRIIGRQGKTVKAIRQLLAAAAAKSKLKVTLAVQE
ncbi:KH domain-containing protein [bacterium]|nr:KH domain-containing protein [bacterium]